MNDFQPEVNDVIAVAEFRAALRQFLRRSERVARQSGLTPQRHLLLLMIKGSPGGDEQSTVTQLSQRLQLAQSTVTELSAGPRRPGWSSARSRSGMPASPTSASPQRESGG